MSLISLHVAPDRSRAVLGVDTAMILEDGTLSWNASKLHVLSSAHCVIAGVGFEGVAFGVYSLAIKHKLTFGQLARDLGQLTSAAWMRGAPGVNTNPLADAQPSPATVLVVGWDPACNAVRALTCQVQWDGSVEASELQTQGFLTPTCGTEGEPSPLAGAGDAVDLVKQTAALQRAKWKSVKTTAIGGRLTLADIRRPDAGGPWLQISDAGELGTD